MRYTKMLGALFFGAALLLLFIPIAGAGTEIFEIKEKMFFQQCNDVYINAEDYIGKTVKLEGMYMCRDFKFPNSDVMQVAHYVYRKAFICCNDDGIIGFMVLLDDCPAPRQNEWVEATGKVEIIAPEKDGGIVVLRLTSLEVLDKRGAEYVRF